MRWIATTILSVAAMLCGIPSASARVVTIDDFSQLGTPPPTSTNSWNKNGLTNVHGGAREQSKTGSASSSWSISPRGLSLTTTSTTSSSWEIWYDGVSAAPTSPGSFSSFPYRTPGPIDVRGTSWLRVEMDSVAPAGTGTAYNTRPAAVATLKWSTTATSSVQTSTLELSLRPYYRSSFLFSLSRFSTGLNLQYIRGIKIRFQGLGAGVTTIRRIVFQNIPEPSTMILATLGLLRIFSHHHRQTRRSP